MTLDGEQYRPTSPHAALDHGVALIHQEIRMVQTLSVAENIFLGRLLVGGGKVDYRTMVRKSREVLDLLGIDLDRDGRSAGSRWLPSRASRSRRRSPGGRDTSSSTNHPHP
jgi:ABC-type sugar transport system ATPase subunit